MPQIQEPDDRFWTPLRVVFVVLLVAGGVYLVTQLFAPPPVAPNDPAPAPSPAPATEIP